MQLLWPASDVPDLPDFSDLPDLYATPDEPWLRLNFVSSLDGAGHIGGKSEPLSGPADKRVFGVLRMLCDALVVGAGTVRAEDYHALRLDEQRRAWRVERGMSEFPTLVIVSARCNLDPGHRVFADAPVRPVVVTRAHAEPGPLADVADIVTAGDEEVDLPAAVEQLHARGLRQILSEGGPRLFGSLTAAGLVDELCLTLSPLLAGPGAERISTGGPVDTPQNMTLRHALLDEGLLLLRYTR